MVLNSILEAVGNTPLVRFNKITRGYKPTILAKLEMLNPGGSIKDRMAIRMIDEAERRGLLKPGGTIVEPTSGNTGVGLAIVAALRGYRLLCVLPDKMSQEKINLLQAYGAEVVVTPTAVERESPESYYSVADRLTREIPGAFQPNQYFNPANPQTHYETTGPEIWNQTDGRITHFVAGMGTGGTISGVSRFLKERRPDLVTVGADPEGSVYSGDTPRPYKVEGIGEDFFPATMDLSLVDRIVRVSDRESFLMARRITREEGILVGGSSGSALCAALEVAGELGPEHLMVVILPDTGRNYLSKIYSNAWMRQHGFLRQFPARRVREALAERRRDLPQLVCVSASDGLGEAIDRMQRFSISQMPVVDEGEPDHLGKLVGSIQERTLLDRIYRDPRLVETAVGAAMDPPFPTINAEASIDEAFDLLLEGAPALVVVEDRRPLATITKLDLLEFVAHRKRDT